MHLVAIFILIAILLFPKAHPESLHEDPAGVREHGLHVPRHAHQRHVVRHLKGTVARESILLFKPLWDDELSWFLLFLSKIG